MRYTQMPGKTPNYSELYKTSVVVLVLYGESPSDITKGIEPTAATIRRWASESEIIHEKDTEKELRNLKEEKESLEKVLTNIIRRAIETGSS